MKRRGNQSPIHRDIQQGYGGVAAGKFVNNDGTTTVPAAGLLLVSESGGFILQTEDGAGIWIDRHGSE